MASCLMTGREHIMDPDACLAEMLDLARAAEQLGDEAHRLAELTISMHEWLSRQGFLPAAWKR
jgi:hypothetical protein